MLETSARLLRLLSLLQAQRDWSGRDLAERLGVTTRTIRADVARLRGLGYPVHAQPGVSGGYRLGVGATLPPLLLDDEAAVAVAVGLRTATATNVAGIEEASVRALTTLDQMLPARLRHRVKALAAATVAVTVDGPTVDVDVLGSVAAAIWATERLRFDYASHTGAVSSREAEPHRLVSWGRRWYLVAWDVDRRDWRTFRVDRISPRTPNGPRFAPRDLPDDPARFVQRGAGSAMWNYRARVTVHAPADQVAARLPPAVLVEAVDASTCVIEVGSDSPELLAHHLGLLEADFEVRDAPELIACLELLARRYLRAAGAAGGEPCTS
jgi:predicted DNA-binding transcriptional regulator YafY